MTLADRVVVMRAGRVEQVGSPDAVYNAPSSMFVAGFIGAPTMNLVPARLEARAGELAVVLGGDLRLPIPPERVAAGAGVADRPVIFGLRPEHLVWAPAPTPGPTIAATASVIEPLGADTLVFFEIGGHELVARVPPEAARRAGDRLLLRPDLGHLHLFDPVTEQRI
jgi:multiple sugar transport system ATP-binding protein